MPNDFMPQNFTVLTLLKPDKQLIVINLPAMALAFWSTPLGDRSTALIPVDWNMRDRRDRFVLTPRGRKARSSLCKIVVAPAPSSPAP